MRIASLFGSVVLPIHSRLYPAIHAATPADCVLLAAQRSTDDLLGFRLARVQLQNHRFELQVIVMGKIPIRRQLERLPVSLGCASPFTCAEIATFSASFKMSDAKSDTSRPGRFFIQRRRRFTSSNALHLVLMLLHRFA